MRGIKVKALRKAVIKSLDTIQSKYKLNFKTAFRKAKRAYNRGEVDLCRL